LEQLLCVPRFWFNGGVCRWPPAVFGPGYIIDIIILVSRKLSELLLASCGIINAGMQRGWACLSCVEGHCPSHSCIHACAAALPVLPGFRRLR
jgi:hypothetical protein